jgi:hypothetical protein
MSKCLLMHIYKQCKITSVLYAFQISSHNCNVKIVTEVPLIQTKYCNTQSSSSQDREDAFIKWLWHDDNRFMSCIKKNPDFCIQWFKGGVHMLPQLTDRAKRVSSSSQWGAWVRKPISPQDGKTPEFKLWYQIHRFTLRYEHGERACVPSLKHCREPLSSKL